MAHVSDVPKAHDLTTYSNTDSHIRPSRSTGQITVAYLYTAAYIPIVLLHATCSLWWPLPSNWCSSFRMHAWSKTVVNKSCGPFQNILIFIAHTCMQLCSNKHVFNDVHAVSCMAVRHVEWSCLRINGVCWRWPFLISHRAEDDGAGAVLNRTKPIVSANNCIFAFLYTRVHTCTYSSWPVCHVTSVGVYRQFSSRFVRLVSKFCVLHLVTKKR